MKSVFILIVGSALLFISCSRSVFPFGDGYYLYSLKEKKDDRFWSKYFEVHSGDTITRVYDYFGAKDSSIEYGKKYIDYPIGEIPFTAFDSGRYIYYRYYYHDRFETKRRYSLKMKDSIIYKKGESQQGSWMSLYLKDTIWVFYGNRIHCKVYVDEPQVIKELSDYRKCTYRYISKKGHILMMRSEVQFEDSADVIKERTDHVLRVHLKPDEVKTKVYDLHNGFRGW